MWNDAPPAEDRIQLLVPIAAIDANSRYRVLSIEQTLFGALALAGERAGSDRTVRTQVDFLGAAGVKREGLAAWLERKQRRGVTVLTAA